MTALRAGFAQRDITPPLGLPLGGYLARTSHADGVLDPLRCRAAVLEAAGTSLGIVTLDLIHVFGDWVSAVRAQAAEALGVAPEHLLIAATHTHAGPAVFHSGGTRHDAVIAFEHDLAAIVLECLTAARSAASPAQLCFGTAPATGVAANRRDASMLIDDAVRVLCAQAPDGRWLGVIANFACHPTILSAANHSYSGDLSGVAAEMAAGALGCPVLLTNGAAGDVSTRFTRRAATYAEVQRMAGCLAAALCSAAARADSVVLPTAGAPLAGARRSLTVQWRTLASPAVVTARLQAALDDLEQLRVDGADAAAIRLAQSRCEGAQAELWVSSQGGWEAVFGRHRPIAEVQALRCGDVGVVAAPGELFSAAGRWLQSCLGERTLVVGYGNDYLGYFVPEVEARAGGYEALIAMVDPRCEAPLRTALVHAAEAVGCHRTAAGRRAADASGAGAAD